MTNTIVATIPVGLGPFEVAITPDGTRAYVPNQQDFIVSVIDTASNTVVTTIPIGGTAGVAITPDGTRVYVTSPGGGSVSVIDTATNSAVATIPFTNQNPVGVAITPDGTRAYVTINFPNNIVSGNRYRDQRQDCDHSCWSRSNWDSHYSTWNASLRD